MTDTIAAGSGDDVSRLVESAQRLGIELDAADTERWLAAMTTEEGVETSDIVIDEKDGVFGHRVSMLDFSPTRPGPVPPDRRGGRGDRARGHRRGSAGPVRLGRPVEDPDPPR